MLPLMLLIALELAATPEPAAPAKPPTLEAHDGWSDRIEVTGTIDGTTSTHGLLVYLPKGYTAAAGAKKWPLVVALHGWKHSAEMFRDKGTLAAEADRHGIVVAVPDMGTTIYETAMYQETRAKKAWSKLPGARWVGEVILPWVRGHFAVHGDRAHTGVLGYSTGGRGAVLLAELYPEFAFAGSTSGTFDLMRLAPKEGEYKIHAVVYGEREKFPARWELDNIVNPALLAKLIDVRLYVSHGSADKSVNPNQVDALRDALKTRGEVQRVSTTWLVQDGAIHDWPFWNTQWPPMFAAAAEVFATRSTTP